MATPTVTRNNGPKLRPRVYDASEMSYGTAVSLVGSDDAYIERKAGTTLVVR
jgi:hypothetical protein